MAYDPNNIFAKILDGSIPSAPVHETENSFAFSDISPRAPTHDLVIPKGAYEDLTAFAEDGSDEELADWVRSLVAVAKKAGITESGYRIIVSCGPDGHQEVPHLHGHVLGGRRLGFMIKTPE